VQLLTVYTDLNHHNSSDVKRGQKLEAEIEAEVRAPRPRPKPRPRSRPGLRGQGRGRGQFLEVESKPRPKIKLWTYEDKVMNKTMMMTHTAEFTCIGLWSWSKRHT